MFDGLKYRSLRRRHEGYMAQMAACVKQMNRDNGSAILAEVRAIVDLNFTVVCEMRRMMAELDVEIDDVTVLMIAHMRNVA